jgi:phosphoserine phosphatase
MMASRVDKLTGKTHGLNCHDVEKVRRLNEKYSDYVVMESYSDSLKSDKPILDLAKKAYLVKGEKLTKI